MKTLQSRTARHSQSRRNRSLVASGILVTSASIGLAVLLLLVTFVGDWLRSPGLKVASSRELFSPNNDSSFDVFDLTYELENSAQVTVRVLAGSHPVRVLLNQASQAPGKHFLTWDGRDDNGVLLPDGNYQIQLIAQSALQSESRALPVQIDRTPPTVSLLNTPDQVQVNTRDLALEGITEPGALLWWNEGAPITVDSSGRFRLPLQLQEGTNTIILRASDAAGNVTELRRQIVLTTRGPEISLLRPGENEWTNQQVITIQGRITPGATLTINRQKVYVDPDGTFTYQLALNPGENLIHIEGADALGNTTTLDRMVYFKSGVRPIELNIEDGTIIPETNLQLVGKVEPGSRVSVNGQSVPVGILGDFQVTLSLLKGENTIVVEAIDKAGNVERVTRRVIHDPAYDTGSSIERVGKNFSQNPWLALPALLLSLLILGFIYWRQNHVELSLALNRDVYNPANPAEESLEIYLTLSQTARVTVEILDAQGQPRAILLKNRRKLGRQHILYWNGLDDRARLVPPGEYVIRAEAGSPPLRAVCSVPLRIGRAEVTAALRPSVVRQRVGNEPNR